MDILKLPDKEILKITHQLRVAYKLKRTLRYGTKRDFSVHSESVAEHIFALIFLSRYFLPLEDPRALLNAEKIYSILLFHDFGEIVHGDIPYPQKTKEHETRERKDAKEVFASLPSTMRSNAYVYWEEYDARQTPEASFAYAIDKIEPLFELLDPVNEKTPKLLKQNYESHITVKLRATENFPVMRRFVEIISKNMYDRDIFWKE